MEEWVKSLKNYTVLSGDPEKEELKAISYDSRTAKAGDLFLCMKGTKLDSHDRILELIHKEWIQESFVSSRWKTEGRHLQASPPSSSIIRQRKC